MNEPMLIGLCGRSGTGKGYVCRLFREYGIPSVDTDAVYRTMTGPAEQLSPCMEELCQAFGDGILLPDHSLNRTALAATVFSEQGTAARETLNRITHAHIKRESLALAAEYAQNGFPAVILDAPLLFESGFHALCRYTVCVSASTETSTRRIMERDGISESAARSRLKAQLPQEELLSRCDYHIENELHCETIRSQVAALAEKFLFRAEAEHP